MNIKNIANSRLAWLSVPAFAVAMLFGSGLETQASAGPLVANGDFEQTSLSSPGGYLCNDNGAGGCASNVANWTSTCSSAGPCGGHATPSSLMFANTNASAWNGGFGLSGTIANSPTGGNFIGLDGDGQYRSSISQTINGLLVGATYNVSFYQAAAQQNGTGRATTEQFAVSLGGGTALDSALMNNAPNGFVPWEQQTLSFVANSGSEVLSFLALGGPTGAPPVVLLDGVSMSMAVPEPGTVALLGAGLLGLVAVRRRMTSAKSN